MYLSLILIIGSEKRVLFQNGGQVNFPAFFSDIATCSPVMLPASFSQSFCSLSLVCFSTHQPKMLKILVTLKISSYRKNL